MGLWARSEDPAPPVRPIPSGSSRALRAWREGEHAAAVRLRADKKPLFRPAYPPLPGGGPGGRALAISNEDMMRHWIVVTQQSPDELARCHSQGVGPDQVTLGRQPASTAFDLRHERILGSHLSRQFALGQTSLIPELAKPAARRGAQLHRQRV